MNTPANPMIIRNWKESVTGADAASPRTPTSSSSEPPVPRWQKRPQILSDLGRVGARHDLQKGTKTSLAGVARVIASTASTTAAAVYDVCSSNGNSTGSG